MAEFHFLRANRANIDSYRTQPLIAKCVYFISDIHKQEINNWSSTNDQITRGVRGNLLHTDTISILLEDESQLCIYQWKNEINACIFVWVFVV
jgi:hypothetical protein